MSNGNVVKKKKRIFYFDALRALAILAVILFHTSSRIVPLIENHYTEILNMHWLFGDFFWAGMIIGVDLFLMLSGALSLGRDWSIRSFLGKRIPRIVAPFLFWAIVLTATMLSLQYFYPDLLHIVDAFNFDEIFNFFIGALRSKSWGFGPYWFFWMILGTYLIMPIFNKWLYNADLKEAEYFLVIWLVTCLFDATINVHIPIKLTYFTGPIGMVVLGYYLRYTERKIFNNKLVPIILIIVGLFCLLYGSFLQSSPNELFKFDRYSIFNAIEVTGIFLLFRNLSGIKLHSNYLASPDNIFRKAIFSIAKYSYGFYLLHQGVMDIFIRVLKYYDVFNGYETLFILIFIVTLTVSWIIMAILNRIPYINQVIGAK